MSERHGEHGAGARSNDGGGKRRGAIRVLLMAEDAESRSVLVEALRVPDFVVVDAVSEAAAASRACDELAPDVVVVDEPGTAEVGLAAVEDIMAFRPTPILLLTDEPHGPRALEALAHGALDVMKRDLANAAELSAQLATRLRLLAGVRVITHVRGRHTRKREAPSPEGPPIVCIAASLGGPRALAAVLRGLPADLPAAICVVQHISQGFSHGLASWLGSESRLAVKEAADGEPLVAGTVFVAPAGSHLLIGEHDTVELDDGPAVEGFKPSATAMFASLAQRGGRRAIGVVLTGMGRDGAEGLAAVRAAGGHTIAQDEASSVVYGMPKAAAEAGAVERVLPLEEIAGAIIGLVLRFDGTGGGP